MQAQIPDALCTTRLLLVEVFLLVAFGDDWSFRILLTGAAQ